MKNISRISGVIFLILAILIINSCEKKPTLPILTTSTVTSITPVTATSGGEVTNDGGATVISRGICWNTSQNPTIVNDKTNESGTIGAFASNLNQLNPSTLYHVRAYASNSAGTGYGNQVTFTTQQPDPISVTDADGNIYDVVRIGTQLWMKENVKTTKWPDGTIINLVKTEFTWASLSVTTKAYCWLNDNIANKDIYGALYTWAAAQGACPTGWHVPSDAEWTILANPARVNNTQFAGCRMSTGRVHSARHFCPLVDFNTN